MSGEMDAAGALATAGLVAGAIEGQQHAGAHEGACLNCGAQLTGPYCSQCGQHGHAHRKLTHVAEEFLHGIWHFDTKAWRTLPMLLLRPGTLTRHYVYGQRVRYVSPLALFLFSIFLMFFVFAVVTPHEEAPAPAQAVSEFSQQDLDEARQGLTQAQAALAEARTDGTPPVAVALLETAVTRAQAEVDRLEAQAAERNAPPSAAVSEGGPAEDGGLHVGVSVAGEPVAENRRWQDELREKVDRGEVTVNLGNERLNEKALETLRNPDLALYKVEQAAYKFSFLLAPLSLPFIAFLFLLKRGVTLYDHMVYALYALSFAAFLFLSIMLTARLPPWGQWLPLALLFVGLPVHTYFHLKGAYALGWFSALWRTFFMLMFASIILSLYITIIVFLGLAG